MLYYLTNNTLNKTSAAFRIGGPDAYTYLQGQFTQDLNRPSGAAGYGLFLNQKGKVVADGYVLRVRSDDFRLVSFSLSSPVLRKRLEAYLIADEVTIEDETDDWARISLWGVKADAAIAKLLGVVPGPDAWCEAGNMRAFRVRCRETDGFELLLPRAAAGETGAALGAMGALGADENTAEYQRIVRGIPSVPADIGMSDLPNEGGLDEVAISYTKGCYLGQEVMARLKNLGQVRRRLHLVRGQGGPPGAGTGLFQNDRKVGDLRSAARDGTGFVAMAMLSQANLDETGRVSLSPSGPANITVMRRV